ncbi:hypothetical protein PIIN_10379 [Serendipita indica DSM 11827]|uniref:Uncharacterized protein n=1 Tax=Serendipita indica (strain DSM 11827) TaxID=1109443 RepID=G4TYJ3_SERID|nr:hypothetical protein PIIN_10379 [Serendipita indica DSM 11827]
MDLTARQYLAHHHHQAEINRALMELFHLIDIFLQSDEKARDSLTVLCLVSNYLQQKGVIGSMQAAKCDANQSINSNGDPLADLAGLIASQSLVAGSTLVNSSKRAPAQSSIHQAQFLSPSSMGIPTRYESPVERAATQRRVRTTEELPSFISVLREGVRAWLTRPTTHALRKWTYHNSSQIAPPDSRKRYERTGVGDPVQRSGQPSSVQTHPRADEISEDEFVMVDYPQMTDRPLPRPPSDYHHCSSSAMDSPGRTTSYNDVHRDDALPDNSSSPFLQDIQQVDKLQPPTFVYRPPTPLHIRRVSDPWAPKHRTRSVESSPIRERPSLYPSHISEYDSVQYTPTKPATNAYLPRVYATPSLGRGTPVSRKEDSYSCPRQGGSISVSSSFRRPDVSPKFQTKDLPPRYEAMEFPLMKTASLPVRSRALSHPQISVRAPEKVDRRRSLNSSDTSIVSQESMSTLRDAEEPEEEVEEIKVLPSGEVLYLSGEDLEEWKQGEEIERREREAWKTYSNELEHACEGVASSIPGGILADIARRRKSLTSSHSVGLWSSRRSGR